MTNKEFAEQDTTFQDACEEAGLQKPTTRQASKWRNHKGIAYKRKFRGTK